MTLTDSGNLAVSMLGTLRPEAGHAYAHHCAQPYSTHKLTGNDVPNHHTRTLALHLQSYLLQPS